MRNLCLFSALILALFASGSFAFIHPDYVCPGVYDDSCILINGQPCFNSMTAAADAGCQGQWLEDYQGYYVWSGDNCYCPYVYPEQADLCANVHCYDKCEYSTEYRSGSCNPDTGDCIYPTANHCDYGCSGSFCADAPEVSAETCTGDFESMKRYCVNYCSAMAGTACTYAAVSSESANVINTCTCCCEEPCVTTDTYRFIDCTKPLPEWKTSNEKPPASETDKCANVECDPKCEGTVSKTNGNCDSDTGECAYTETNCYEMGCNPENFMCNVISKVAGRIYYTDYSKGSAETVPLKEVAIIFEYTTPEGKTIGTSDMIVYTDSEGNFEYDDPAMMQPGNMVNVYVGFMDQSKKFYVTIDSQRDSAFILQLMSSYDSTDSSLQTMDFDLYDSEDYPFGRDFAKAYQYVQKAISFKENFMGLKPTLQERVRLFSSDGTWHASEYNSDKSSTGMAIRAWNSKYETFDAPTNREFHEYCHHIHAESLGAIYQKEGCDHCGYFENPTTAWGLVEGWAEYCSLEMKKYYNMGSEGLYEVDDTVWNLEYDYKIDSKEQPTTSEELAIAGILLDLSDSSSDYSDGRDDDSISLPFSTVWGAFKKNMDFGDGKGTRPVLTLRDFYTSLVSMTGSSSAIDNVFINHNAFQDLNNNEKRDSDEPAGYSGKSTDLRMDLTSEPGTSISISGMQGGFVKVSVQMTGDKGRSYSFDIPLSNGKVAIPMPPKDYPATITVTALDKATSFLASNSFSTTTEQIYHEINPGSDFGTYSVSGFSAASCYEDYQCENWNLGNKCSNGNCVTEQKPNPVSATTKSNVGTNSNGNATSSGSDAACCGGPAAIALIVSIALIKGRKEE